MRVYVTPCLVPRLAALALLLPLLLTILGAAASVAAEERPNVLLIVSEDNGPHFGCYGDTTVPTPHLDALASAGVRFEQAYVTQSVCSPSRSSILTGMYPHENGQLGLATHEFTMWRHWPTLPTLLREAGYRTGMLGKLHVLPERAFAFDFRWAPREALSFAHRDVYTTAEVAGEFMRGEQPFFLMVNWADAHLPFLPQQFGLPHQPLTAADVRTPEPVGIETPRLREHAANYYNCLSRLDSGIGLLLEQLEASGQRDNTLVVYLADHGPQFGRGKTTCYEFALRVPLLVHWPGVTRSGQVRRELVSTIDLVPTILAAAHVERPDHLQGRSLMPLLRGQDVAWREYLFCEWNTSHTVPGPSLLFPQRCVRDARYKLIRNLLPGPNPTEEYYTTQALVATGANQAEIDVAPETVQSAYATWRNAPPVELYDLHADPNEQTNLADHPELADVQSRLLAELEAWQGSTRDPLADPRRLEQLVAEDQDRAQTAGQQQRKQPWRYPQYLYE